MLSINVSTFKILRSSRHRKMIMAIFVSVTPGLNESEVRISDMVRLDNLSPVYVHHATSKNGSSAKSADGEIDAVSKIEGLHLSTSTSTSSSRKGVTSLR